MESVWIYLVMHSGAILAIGVLITTLLLSIWYYEESMNKSLYYGVGVLLSCLLILTTVQHANHGLDTSLSWLMDAVALLLLLRGWCLLIKENVAYRRLKVTAHAVAVLTFVSLALDFQLYATPHDHHSATLGVLKWALFFLGLSAILVSIRGFIIVKASHRTKRAKGTPV